MNKIIYVLIILIFGGGQIFVAENLGNSYSDNSYCLANQTENNYVYNEQASSKKANNQTSNLSYNESDYTLTYPIVTELTLPDIIRNKMLFQQKKPIKVWGAGVNGSNVTVTLKKNNDTIETKQSVVTNNAWEVVLAPQNASYDVYELDISDGITQKHISGILFGELFLSAGQSNMALNTQYCSDAETLLNSADNPNIRFFSSAELGGSANYPYSPAFINSSSGSWGSGDNNVSVGGVSAVTYTFALEMFDKLNVGGAKVPIGFLNTAKGATSIHAWISKESTNFYQGVRDYLNERGQILPESEYNKKGSNNFNQLSAMFNSRIAPLSKMAVSAILWYQGENNVGNETAGDFYKLALDTLVKDWSNWFNGGIELPLVYSHPAPHNYKYEQQALAYMWEGMSGAWSMSPKNRSQAPIYDVPLDWFNAKFTYRSPIHPIVKTPVGKRMAQSVYGLVYGGDYVTAPTYKSVAINGRYLKIKFDNVGSGLKSRDGKSLKNFTVCGNDGIYYSAVATISASDEVTLYSGYVACPKAATYAFSTMPISANLSNSYDFPAAPFRTDRTIVNPKYYQPKDWHNFDSLDLFVSDGSGTAIDIAGIRPLYETSNNVDLSIANDIKDVDSSLKVDYTLFSRGVASVSPIIRKSADNESAISDQFEQYDTIKFKVCNIDSRDKKMSVKVKLITGETGYLYLTKSSDISVNLDGDNKEFYEYSFNLNTLSTDMEDLDISLIKALISEISFEFYDMREGVVYIDSCELGNCDAYAGAPIVDNELPTAEISVQGNIVGEKVNVNIVASDNVTPSDKLKVAAQIEFSDTGELVDYFDGGFAPNKEGKYKISITIIDEAGNIFSDFKEVDIIAKSYGGCGGNAVNVTLPIVILLAVFAIKRGKII